MALTLGAVILVLGSQLGLYAQSEQDGDEDERQRVLRDQTRMSARLNSLQEKMQRLSERYENEGRTHNAELLREAIARFESDSLLNQARDIEQSLSRSMLDTVEKQNELAGSLESIYSVLSDRRDVDDVRSKVDLANAAIAEIGNLIVDQKRLLSQTRSVTDNPSELVETAAATAEKLDDSLADAEKAAARAEAAEMGFSEVALAEQLAKAQRALASSSSASAEQQRLVSEKTDELLQQLSEPLEESGSVEAMASVEQMRSEARDAVSRGREAMEQAESQMRRGGDASEQAEQAEGLETQPDAESAAEPVAEAAAELEEARDLLREAERGLAAARNRAMASARLELRQAQAESEKLDDIAERLETLQPEEGPELLDRTRALLDQIAKLNKSMEAGESRGAQESVAQARMDLNQLLKQLGQRDDSRDGEQKTSLGQEQAAQMIDKQEQLEKQLRQLMDRLEDMPDQTFREPGEQAASSMQQASKSMESGDAGEASVRQEEAVEELEKAQEELQGELNRYERLRQEEVLYQLAEELTRLRDAQLAIGSEIRDIDDARSGNDRLSRSHKRALSRLSSEESELSRQTDELKVALEADSAVAFVFTIEQTRDDMNDVAGRLAERETDFVVMAMIESIEQRINDLLSVLESEKERRREAMENDQGEEPPPPQQEAEGGKPSLVPEVAELLLIQKLELSALSRLEAFQRLHPELQEEGALGPVERGLLERWALEHTRVTEVFLSMIPESPEVGLPPGVGIDDQGDPTLEPDPPENEPPENDR
ncbi:MAG: hypothetical protein P8N09_02430 [Planctomycetota bacterium]|nr:hypothetical protein [Planctomycetota bacterium]